MPLETPATTYAMSTLPLPPFDLPVTSDDRMLASTLTGARTDAEITRTAQFIRQYVNAENAKQRDALNKIVQGGYAPGSDVAHPAIGLARNALLS